MGDIGTERREVELEPLVAPPPTPVEPVPEQPTPTGPGRVPVPA